MKTKTVLVTVLFNILMGVNPQQGRALAQGMNKTYENKKNTLEFVPVKLAKKDDDSAYCFNHKTYLPLEKKGVAIKDFQFQKFADKKLGLKFDVGPKEASELQKLSQKYRNQKMAVLVNGNVVSVPELKHVIMGEGFEITVQDLAGFDKLYKSLVN